MTLPRPKLANPIQGLLAMRSRSRFVARAVPHNLAAELGSKQIAAAYEAGTWPAADWEANTRTSAATNFGELRKQLLRSALASLALTVLSLMVAAALGKVSLFLPLDWGKSLTAVGAAIAAWGGFFQFRAPAKTCRGNLLHEVARRWLLILLLGIGAVIAAVGALWW